MAPALRNADEDLLKKLLLGQLPSAEVERLATEYADDGRLAALAEGLAQRGDTLLDSLRNHATEVDSKADRLVERLLERLRVAQPADDATLAPTHTSSFSDVPPADARPLPKRFEYFQVLQALGQGGMGTVYLAEDTRLGRQVALKTLRPELAANPQAKNRFLREARAAAKLEHDHIIPIYYVGEAEGTPFLAMPLLRGESLQSHMEGVGGPLPVAQVIRIARETASGLAAAHERGLIHRDIKPANLWLEASPARESGGFRVKILDFGLARHQTDDSNLTAHGDIVGTPSFMAPEQARGGAVDHRADLFSLGCVMYEMLTGQRSFAGSGTMAILSSLALDTPRAPHTLNPHCSAEQSQLVMSLLEKDPAARPASAQKVIEQLSQLDSSATAIVAADAVPPRADVRALADDAVGVPTVTVPIRRRRRPVLIAVAALLLALLPVGYLYGPTIYRFVTNQGELVIEVDDPSIEVKIMQDGVVVQDTTGKRQFTLRAGKGEIEVLEKDGVKLKTKQFELTRGGKTTVKVTFQELAEARKPREAGDPDRKAAEYVLFVGGNIRIREDGKEGNPKLVGDLPRGPFELRIIDLAQNTKVNDAGLTGIKDCKNLTHLFLHNSEVTDAGLERLSNCTNLTLLTVNKTRITAAGIDKFKKALPNCQIEWDGGVIEPTVAASTDHALSFDSPNNVRVPSLNLDLSGPLTIEGYVTQTKQAVGHQSPITVTGLSYVQSGKVWALVSPTTIKNYTVTGPPPILNKKIHVAGVYDRKAFRFYVDGQLMGETTIDKENPVKPDKAPLRIGYEFTGTIDEVRISKVARYDKDFTPKARFEPDADTLALYHFDEGQGDVLKDSSGNAHHGKIAGATWVKADGNALADADRRAAEWVLSIGGSMTVVQDGFAHKVGAARDLPRGAFELTTVYLSQNPSVTNTGLAHFKECKNLTHLELSHAKVSDTGLVHFKDCKNLTRLDLRSTQVSDAGLAHFRDCKNLMYLELDRTLVSDAGLVHFKDCKNLTGLDLQQTRVSDAGLAHFKECKNLKSLRLLNTNVSNAGLAHLKDCKNLVQVDLGSTQVSDAVLAHFRECKNLKYLSLIKTKVSEAGIEELKKALPGCKIEWDGGIIEPTGVAAGFREVHGVTATALQEWSRKLPEGFRPIWVAARNQAVPPMFDAIAIADPGVKQWFIEMIDDEATEGVPSWNRHTKAGYELTMVALYVSEKGFGEARLWTLPNNMNWQSYGGRVDVIEQKLRDAAPKRLSVVSISTARRDDQARSTVQIDGGIGPEWMHHLELNKAELADHTAQYRSRGWRPRILYPVQNLAPTRYLAVFEKNDSGIAWEIQQGMTVTEYERELQTRRQKNMRPQCVWSEESGKGASYGALWIGPPIKR